jgi:Uma2 family endonuclease
MTLLKAPLLNAWISATWEEFITVADAPACSKLKGYYFNGRMRFEPMSTGSDHSKDHTTIILGVGLFASLRSIPMNGHDGCSYCKTGYSEFQPDASYYIGNRADAIPWGTRVIDLDQYPLPNLVIEISDIALRTLTRTSYFLRAARSAALKK